MAAEMYNNIAKLTVGNFAEFKTDACLDQLSMRVRGKAKCICCLSYVEAKSVVDFVVAAPNVFSAICPNCSVPSLLSRTALESHGINVGAFIHTHLTFFKHLHDKNTRGCRVEVASYWCDGINCRVIVTVPNTEYGQTRLKWYKFETLRL